MFHFSVKVNMGDLQSEESRDVVIELTIDAVPMPYNETKQKLFTSRVDYFNVITNLLSNGTADLSVFRPGLSILFPVKRFSPKFCGT